MTPEERIDAALDNVLKASGSALKHYTMQSTLDRMRKAMTDELKAAYIQGSNDNYAAFSDSRRRALKSALGGGV